MLITNEKRARENDGSKSLSLIETSHSDKAPYERKIIPLMYGEDITLSRSLCTDKLLVEAFIITCWKVQSRSHKISYLCFCNIWNS